MDKEIEIEFNKIWEKIKELERKLDEKKELIKKNSKDNEKWYKEGSTISKIVTLIDEGFFKIPKNIINIIEELKSRDYHLKPSDLTLPLRKIVRKNLLNRTKTLQGGSKSKIWHYVNN